MGITSLSFRLSITSFGLLRIGHLPEVKLRDPLAFLLRPVLFVPPPSWDLLMMMVSSRAPSKS